MFRRTDFKGRCATENRGRRRVVAQGWAGRKGGQEEGPIILAPTLFPRVNIQGGGGGGGGFINQRLRLTAGRTDAADG